MNQFIACQADERAKRKFRCFLSGRKQFKKWLKHTHKELQDGVKAVDPNFSNDTTPSNLVPTNSQVHCAGVVKQHEMNLLLQLLSHGSVGFMSKEKHSGWITIMSKNFNSIGIGMQDWKIDHLNSLDSSLHIDVLAGCERNLELHQIDKHHQLLDLLVPGTSKCGIVAHNTMGDILHQAQHDDTMVTAFG